MCDCCCGTSEVMEKESKKKVDETLEEIKEDFLDEKREFDLALFSQLSQ